MPASHLEALTEGIDQFTELRRRLHRQPELGFDEHQTSELVARLLTEWGYEVHRGLAGTGVVGTLKVGQGHRALGLRADMDALPIQEDTGQPWQSEVPGKFHGCGHDGHTTSLLAAAKRLSETRNFDGTLHLIFQPAEELLYGGRVMLDDGLFEKFPCDAIFAFHNAPTARAGDFYFRSGQALASSDTLRVVVTGKSSHGAMPEYGTDANLVASHIVVALQSIVSRNVSALQQAVVTVGRIEGGKAPNVLSARTVLDLTVRAIKPDIRQQVLRRINEVVEFQARSFGAVATVEVVNACPSLSSGAEATRFAVQVAEQLVGREKVHTDMSLSMGSEDFAFMLEANPNGSYFLIGNGEHSAMLHHPKYDFNDAILPVAAAYWCALTENYLVAEAPAHH